MNNSKINKILRQFKDQLKINGLSILEKVISRDDEIEEVILNFVDKRHLKENAVNINKNILSLALSEFRGDVSFNICIDYLDEIYGKSDNTQLSKKEHHWVINKQENLDNFISAVYFYINNKMEINKCISNISELKYTFQSSYKYDAKEFHPYNDYREQFKSFKRDNLINNILHDEIIHEEEDE